MTRELPEGTALAGRKALGYYLRDLALVLIGLPLILPLALGSAIVALIALGSPILFRQRRAGFRGREFTILKFRTMHDYRDAAGLPLPDADRRSAGGDLLRRYRLDELPAFLNVVRGEISLVGPRPLWWLAVDSHPLGRHRLDAVPGFTGLSQVSGNTLLTNAEKFAIDALYIRTRTGWGDLVILARTVLTLVQGERRDESVLALARRQLPEYFEGAGA